MSHGLKKYIFLVFVAVILILSFQGLVLYTLILACLLVFWLAIENKNRNRFRFLSNNATAKQFSEWNRDLAVSIAMVEFCQNSQKLAVLTANHRLLVLDVAGVRSWEIQLETAPLAVLPAPGDGPVYVAWEERIDALGTEGKIVSSIAFDPPEFKQAYTLHLSENGKTLLLQTPWFLQSFAPDLSAQGPRLKHDQVGNFMKYLSLSGDGERVFVGGALLLEEEGIQARWSLWNLKHGEFTLAWLKEDKGQANSHLRGLQYSQGADVLLVESYRDGYDILVYNHKGEELWKRGGGEHPVMAADGRWILWENPFDGITLTALEDRKKFWTKAAVEKIRLKHVDARGICTVLEGRHLFRFDAEGNVQAEDWFHTDPVLLKLSPDGRTLAVARQGHLGILQLERP